jgi:hypothetical protein
MQGQSKVQKPPAKSIHHALCIFLGLEADDEVIGVPDPAGLAAEPRLHPLLEPTIECMVQIDVPQQRREHRPLSGAGFRRGQLHALQHAHVQALPDEPQQRPIGDPNLEHLLQLLAIQAVEEGHDVSLENPVHLTLVYGPVEGPHGVMGAAPGPEAVRAVQEVLLVDRLQHLAQGVLDPLVLERRNPNRPRLPPFLRDVDTADRLMAISLRLHPCVQVLEVSLQILPVLFLRDSIHTHCSIFTGAAVGALQGRHIDQMCQ